MAAGRRDPLMRLPHGELVKIEEEIRKARDRHNKYLRELGLPPLP